MSDPSASSGQAERERVWEAYVEWCARNDPERTGDYGVFVGGWDARAAEVGRLRDAVQAQRRRIDWGDGESRRKVVYADAERDALRAEVGELRKISEMKDDLESENIDLRARLATAERQLVIYRACANGFALNALETLMEMTGSFNDQNPWLGVTAAVALLQMDRKEQR